MHKIDNETTEAERLSLQFFKDSSVSESSWTRGHFHARRKVRPINAKDHIRLGEKVFFNLTEETKLFTM